MSFDNLLSKITALISAAAAIIFFAGNAIVYGGAAQVMGQMNEAADPRDPWAARRIAIFDHRDADGRGFKPGYLEMAKGGDIRANRFVAISAYVTVRELLEAGEKPPAASMEEVFAKSRAVIFARAECQRLLRSLARECAVAGAEGRINDGLVRIDAMFRFVQRDDFGALDESATYVFTTADSRLVQDEPVYRERAADARSALYKKAAAECAAIRRRDGSCAITGLLISARADRAGAIRHSATANYAFLIKERA